MSPRETVHQVLERVATEDRGRILAYLASRFGDSALAEDALSNAFIAALMKWAASGIPDQPAAWILAAARNNMLDHLRHREVENRFAARETASEQTSEPATDIAAMPDRRLELLFVCAHPAIDPAVRTPLMLQAVFRLEIAQIADAFVMSPTAMGQRLSRAKAKIAQARIPFAVPEPEDLSGRLDAVLQAIYAAYTAGWDDLSSGRGALASEAIWLARVLASLLPGQPEVRGLLALLLHAEARRTATGAFVPLAGQDVRLWSVDMREEAERELHLAHALKTELGAFQLEAAIQSAHASRAATGATPWTQIANLYEALVQVRPSLGALVGRAAARGAAFGPEQGLAALQETAAYKNRFSYQSYWACLAQLSSAAGLVEDAHHAYLQAIELSHDPAVRAHLHSQLTANVR